MREVTRRTSKGYPAQAWLALAALATVILWQFPLGRTVLYPFTLFATYAHELGHGLTALLLGADFESLELNPDGSGLARWNGHLGRIGCGLVAAGGLIGPSFAGAGFLALSRAPKRAPAALYGLSFLMILSLLLVRSVFGFLFLLTCIGLLIAIARVGSRSLAAASVQVLGIELAVAVFRDLDYMFSDRATVAGVTQLSDSAQIATALFLPYWFWGALIALGSFLILAAGLRIALGGRARM